MAQQVIETELRANTKDAVQGIKNVTSEVNKLGQSLSDMKDQLDAILTQFQNVGKQAKIAANNAYSLTGSGHTVVSSQGLVQSPTGRDKFYKEYSAAAIEEINARKELTNEVKADVAERKRLRKQRADTETARTQNEAARIAKIEDRNSKEYIEDRRKLADARLLNAKNNAGLRNNVRYQFGGAVMGVGAKIASSGAPGTNILGNFVQILGGSLKSAAIGGALALEKFTEGFIDFSKAAMQAYAEIESIKTQLGVVFSSQTQADSMFGEIAQYATKSPFGVQQTSELAVLLKQSGVYASDLMDTLKMIGDTAGGNMEKMKRIANNYAQIVSIGKASMLDMRQFAYAGIPIFEAVSNELKVSQQELRKLISDGKVTSDIIEKVFKDLTGVNGIFENATEKGAKTLKARLQNLQDAKQLGLAEVGKWIFNLGTNTGNDSYANRLVTFAENIYGWLKDYTEPKNISSTVKTIARNQLAITGLKQLIEKAENDGDKRLANILKMALKEEQNKFNTEQRRAAYVQSYDYKTKVNDNISKYFEAFDIPVPKTGNDLTSLFKSTNREFAYRKALSNNDDVVNWEEFKNTHELSQLKDWSDGAIKELHDFLEENWVELNKIVKNYQKIVEIERQANYERNTINAQSLSADNINKSANSVKSLNKGFEELASIFENTEEEKARREEEHTKLLKEQLQTLKTLASYTDGKGNVDLTQIRRADVYKYIKEGAFQTGRSLTVAPSDNPELMARDRAQLVKQYKALSRDIGSEFKKDNQLLLSNYLKQAVSELEEIKDDTQFFQTFSATFEQANNYLATLYKRGVLNEEEYNSLKQSLADYTNQLTLDERGASLLSSKLNKALSDINVPLWKRVLAEYTGLTTNGMTDSKSTMENYRDDMAVRNTAKDVMKAAFDTMGYNAAVNLISTNGTSAVLPNSGSATYQVDWKKVRKNLADFSLQLSASTDVISAYTAGLKAELDTYKNLTIAGFTQGESQDLSKQKTITKEQFEKIMSYGDQLVNPFGGQLVTKEGEGVTFKDNKFYNAKGEEVAVEELRLTDNLYKFIENILPKIYKEIGNAEDQNLKNTQLAEMLKDTQSAMLNSGILRTMGVNSASSYLLTNADYTKNKFDSRLTEAKQSTSLKYKSNADILLEAERGSLEAISLLTTVFNQMETDVNAFLNSTEYKQLTDKLRNLPKDTALDELVASLSRGSDMDNSGTLSPDEYKGGRGFRNFIMSGLGYNKAYDQEDWFVKAALTAPGANGKNLAGMAPAKAYFARSEYEKTYDEAISNGASPEEARLQAEQAILDIMTEEEKSMARQAEQAQDMQQTMTNLAKDLLGAMSDFASNALTSTFSTWGKSLAEGADAGKSMRENFRELSAGLMSSMGQMMTQAGLAMIIGSLGKGPKFYAGLAMVAAGAGASFLGGYLSASDSDDNEDEDKLAKLNKLKDDLTDLLKQARQDAIYYENTLRHQKAVSANSAFTTKVNDAIITPSGNVISTHPDDYLIATKTPQTLLGGGSGSPTINFSVIDKSTGIRVTQQKSTYNEDTNSIDFEAVIESKVNEIIASAKGDDAFAAREARLNGRSVIA